MRQLSQISTLLVHTVISGLFLIVDGDLSTDLLQLTGSFQGQLGRSATDWVKGTQACTWTGVNCTGSQTLTALDLSNKQLTGTINASALELPSFAALFSLNVSRNTLAGTLPSLAGLVNVSVVDLSHNNFTGSLPDTWAEQTSLIWLDASTNNLTGPVPTAWSYGLDSLTFANLSATNITGPVPQDWSQGLQVLEELWLSDNSLGGSVPSMLPSKLKLVLGPGNNQICGAIPPQVVSSNGTSFTSKLKTCGTRQQGEALLAWAESCPNLPEVAAAQHWAVAWTNDTVDVPCSWTGITRCDDQLLGINLPYVGLQCNFTSAWGGLGPYLNSMSLQGSALGGQLPPDLGNRWINVTDFTFSDARMHSSLPPEWGTGFPNLMNMLLQGIPGLYGTLPEIWGQGTIGMRSIRQLWLTNANLSGSLPPVWATQMASMWEVDFVDCGLTGTLPSQWSTLPQLNSLRAGGNMLNGTIPASWGNLSTLSVLDIPNNAFTGMLPAFGVLPMPKLWAFIPAGNPGLQGPIPLSYSRLPALSKFQVSNTSLCNAAADLAQPGYNLTSFTNTLPLCPPQAPAPAPAPSAPAAVVPAVPATSSSSSSGSSTGPIAGGVAAGVVILALLAGLIALLIQRHNRHRRVSALAPRQESGPTLKSLMGGATITSSDTSTGGKTSQSTSRSGIQLTPTVSTLPLRGKWEIDAAQITIDKKPDGSLWRLGSGAFGTVYRARLDHVQPVAVKMLKPDFFKDKDQDERDKIIQSFVNEVAVLHDCRHPHVVLMIGACLDLEHTGQLSLVQELLVTDLWHALNDVKEAKSLVWRQRGKEIALDVARGLAYLHTTARIIHLDLKSQNILLGKDGSAKIADAGLAVVLEADGSHLYVPAQGTFTWMAPEVLMGNQCSFSADIFSYGVLLWEIATQERPARGFNRPIAAEDAPQYVADLVDRCKAAPQDRPTAVEIVQILEAAED